MVSNGCVSAPSAQNIRQLNLYRASFHWVCEGKGLNHTGNKEALIAQLVEAEQAESKQAEEPVGEPGPEDGPPATETEVESPAPEPETPEPED